MPREMVTLQVGQCGNQLGARFWELALREHEGQRASKQRAAAAQSPVFDDAMSSFFRNVRCSSEGGEEEELGVGSRIERLRARAVLVDMEEGVVMREVMRGRVRSLFDTRQLLTDASGSGNNWAHGHELYARRYEEELMESVRRAVEPCESLQGFFMLHSLGGGTGSGLGSAIMEQLRDYYPQVYRFACSIFPSEDDDVITSPYNAMLSCATLMDAADCVLPIENQALIDICASIDRGAARRGSVLVEEESSRAPPFAAMNGIAADMLLNLTSSVRFEGSLNTDLNEIIMNLVPFPKQHFLVSSMSPLTAPPRGVGTAARGIDSMMSSLFSREHQLIKADPRNGTFIACGLFVRGAATVSDLSRNIRRLKQGQLKFVDWNPDGFKVGLCSVPPVGVPTSALALSNNCCIRQTFKAMRTRFTKLYRKKFYLHHYLQYMEEDRFAEVDEEVRALIDSYEQIEHRGTAAPGVGAIGRLTPVGTSFSM